MRNVFVSYAHRLDQDAVDEFRKKFGNDKMVFSDRSLENMDIGNLSSDTIKNNYIRPKIRNSSVTIVLIGEETGGRWWVDWEIYYSLINTKNNGRNGLLGIRIPYKKHFVPKRLEKNLNMGLIIDMPKTAKELEQAIELAYQKRTNIPDLSDPLRSRNSYI
ncbi:TIR domain-containing protein [Clostridium sp. SM-530-WT-3G]|uniref:TIR domain-containing protein n=1 Tax=Clostridium sp. SM-530-WT-3G TaxID=2725303 RepID=UPI00145EC03C|nr:TIR domain-containing protein [Clostridium sp. SM-530-WT-3G]NME81852.1 TIR domain-containing protein [Clostridium sp. SM-530-WT-3G]